MTNGRRRPLPLRPRGAAAPPGSTRPGPDLASLGIDIDDPLNTRRAVQQFVGEQMAREAAPVRAWLDANIDTLRALAMPALLARVRRNVPEARELPNIQVESIVREWANLNGISIPQLSALPIPGVPEGPPPASGPSLGDSELARLVRDVMSIPTSIEIARPHGRTEISVSGATVELIGGGARVGGSVSWGGTMGVFTEAGGVRFEGGLSAERWSMTLSIPPGTPAPNLSRSGEIFRAGERSMRAIARETASVGSLGEVSEMADAISPHLEPVKQAIEAVRGVAETRERRVSFGLRAGGPGPSPAPADKGFSLNATLTIRF